MSTDFFDDVLTPSKLAGETLNEPDAWNAVTYDATIEPGQFVRHPQQLDWGIGQVQSVIDDRITVNFEHAGKVLVNARVINLEILHERLGGGA